MRKVRLIKKCIIGIGSKIKKNDGFGMNELLGIAAALILAAFIVIPGLKDFAGNVMTKLGSWWSGTVVNVIFPAG